MPNYNFLDCIMYYYLTQYSDYIVTKENGIPYRSLFAVTSRNTIYLQF